MKDYFKILQVGRDVDDSGIKKSYHQLAKQNHPDKDASSGAKERFQAIQEAYDCIKETGNRETHKSRLINLERIEKNSYVPEHTATAPPTAAAKPSAAPPKPNPYMNPKSSAKMPDSDFANTRSRPRQTKPETRKSSAKPTKPSTSKSNTSQHEQDFANTRAKYKYTFVKDEDSPTPPPEPKPKPYKFAYRSQDKSWQDKLRRDMDEIEELFTDFYETFADGTEETRKGKYQSGFFARNDEDEDDDDDDDDYLAPKSHRPFGKFKKTRAGETGFISFDDAAPSLLIACVKCAAKVDATEMGRHRCGQPNETPRAPSRGTEPRPAHPGRKPCPYCASTFPPSSLTAHVRKCEKLQEARAELFSKSPRREAAAAAFRR